LILTIINFTQVNVSELGLVTPAGKVVWGKAFVKKKFSYFFLLPKS
jgi:ribosomal protein S8E